ncbi:hypothetical protein AT705_20205 [Pseudoalteromonas rubra]|uniref:GAF domain-containing protein n=2 Tax=Pseudoalteromonas rubra TaxID=43658 RepID=A0A0U3H1S0_9GAMM|nr:hypothetical protein AT705_20205 [Pseudoalteromonas rubra]
MARAHARPKRTSLILSELPLHCEGLAFQSARTIVLREKLAFDNPLVTGELSIRFYVGCPLKHPNVCQVGTLCLIDFEPRELNEFDASILAQVAADVVERLIKLSHE